MGRKQTKVESLRLPKEVINELRLRGIKYLTPPQEEAVKKGLLNGENILVASPTASGKTLIAELALINAFLRGRKGIYTTPLKTLANEKYEEFSLWSKIGAKIGISTGDYDEPGEWLDRYDIIVTTYERLDSLFRLRPKWLRRVGVVVIDELHNISDEERGPTIELIAIYALKLGAQIVGLSATLSNPEELAEWLGCKLVLSNWRPVKLIEGFYIKRKSIIVFNDGRTEEVLNNNLIDHIIRNALNQHYQVIIFQQARHRAESMARSIASKIPAIDRNTYLEVMDKFKKYEALRSEIKDLDKLVMHGVAYHHAGLSHGAR
ncbi:MAG: DEAD/DEAH box helicase, partial [Desulfurococcales archaeon ex4484_42]